MAGHMIGAQLFDLGLAQLNTNAATVDRLKVHLVEGFIVGTDTYTSITTTKSRGNVSLVQADVSQPADVGPDRRVTISEVTLPGGSTSDTGPAPTDLSVAVVDNTTSAILFVTNETSNQAITGGNPVIVPTFTVGFDQLV